MLCPEIASEPTTIVLTAPRSRASSDSSWSTSAHADLWGIVTFAPTKPSARSPSTAAGTCPGGTGIGT